MDNIQHITDVLYKGRHWVFCSAPCTMVILIRQGRNKFVYSSKPNSGGIVNAKKQDSLSKWYKNALKDLKIGLFWAKM